MFCIDSVTWNVRPLDVAGMRGRNGQREKQKQPTRDE